MARKIREITFVKGTLPTVVWDPKGDRALVEFVNGLYTTSNQKIIDALVREGYKTTKDYPFGPPESGFEHQKTTLAPPEPISDLTSGTPGEDIPAVESPKKKADVGSVKNQKAKIKRRSVKRSTS